MYNELKETMDTTKIAGYANNAETVQALNNLANATIVDRESMANMTATINFLTKQLAETNAKLTQSMQLTSKLQSELANLKGKHPKSPKIVIFDKYCWTHGPQASHDSKSCNRRAEGHQEELTDANRMGRRDIKMEIG